MSKIKEMVDKGLNKHEELFEKIISKDQLIHDLDKAKTTIEKLQRQSKRNAKRAYKFEHAMFEQRDYIKELEDKVKELEEYKYMYEDLCK